MRCHEAMCPSEIEGGMFRGKDRASFQRKGERTEGLVTRKLEAGGKEGPNNGS